MVAIETKFIPATNYRGDRIKAFTSTGLSVTIDWPYEYPLERCHFQAVKALVKKHKLDWDISTMAYGGTERGYVFCFPNSIIKAD